MTQTWQQGHLDCSAWRERLSALCAATSPDPYNAANRFLDEAARLADALPGPIRQTLHRFRRQGNRQGVLLLTGLPVDKTLPPTPSDNQPSGKRSFVSETCLAMVGAKLGDIVGYAQEKHGALIHDITPSAAQEEEQSSEGSRIQLEMHTERCFHPFLPNHVLLYCLRPDRAGKAATFYAGIDCIRERLSDDDVRALFEPEFRTGIDYSFGNLTTAKANGPELSVLYGNPDDPFIRYDLDLMEGLTNRARRALTKLHEAIGASTCQVRLKAGELLVIDNRRAVHGRRPFTARYDGQDRWLQRVYLVSDLSASTQDRAVGSRVINTSFEQYLRPAEAG